MVERRVRPAPRPAPVRPGVQERGVVQSRGEVKVRGELRGARSQEQTLTTKNFSVESPAAFVRVGVGMTINTGNFESLRLDVAVTLPCLPDEVGETYEQASDFAAEYIASEEARWVGKTTRRG